VELGFNVLSIPERVKAPRGPEQDDLFPDSARCEVSHGTTADVIGKFGYQATLRSLAGCAVCDEEAARPGTRNVL
jgi:hypothetical protein